jgi:hypothetical protein
MLVLSKDFLGGICPEYITKNGPAGRAPARAGRYSDDAAPQARARATSPDGRQRLEFTPHEAGIDVCFKTVLLILEVMVAIPCLRRPFLRLDPLGFG